MQNNVLELNNYLDYIVSKVQTMKKELNDELDKKLQRIHNEQQQLDHLSRKIHTISEKSKDIVHFNVGGTRFSTSKSNLLQERSFFSALLSDNFHIERDEQGAIFIDRSPKFFGIVLDYCRTQQVQISHLHREEKEELLQEVKFYEIRSLISIIETIVTPLQFCSQYMTKEMILRHKNTAITVSGLHTNCTIICNKHVSKWRAVIHHCDATSRVMIGMIRKEKFKHVAPNIDGYFLGGEFYGTGNFRFDDVPLCTSGYVVDCYCIDGCLSFKVDGKPNELYYSDVPDDLYPVFDFYGGCSLSIEELE